MANLPHSNARWGLSLPLCVTYQPQEKAFFSFFFADSAKCLHEANALCQIVY